jgi:hypothetical protein
MELLNPVDLLSMGYSDTTQIVAYSISEDSVFTGNLTYTMLGSMNDPIFGTTTATAYTQIFLSKSTTRFGTNPVFDSAYFYIPYNGSYGDTLSNMTLHVYRLTDSINSQVDHYSNSSLAYDKDNPLGEITFQPKPHDSAFFDGKTQAPFIRIPINSSFGNLMFNADTNYLNSSALFIKYFNGVCLVADPQTTPGKGAIITLSMPSDYSNIIMYYHNTEDTLSYIFPITTDCQRFQNYNHNGYAEAIPTLKHQLDKSDISLGQQFLFAQGMGGVKIKIEFPYIKQWFNKEKVVINDAQLIIGNASTSDVFTNPAALTLRGVGEAGSTSPNEIADVSDAEGYFDGTYSSTSNAYRFRIKRYLQQVMTGEINNNGLHLIIPSASYVGTRLVLNGTSSPQSDLKLYLRYTKIK